jgi:pyruvate kinase
MNYDIIATLGPSSQTPDRWQVMLAAGATAFRLNTSHLTLVQLQQWLDRLDPFLNAQHPAPAVVLDLQGSKWRLGEFAACSLDLGQQVELVYAATADRANTLPVPHPDFFQAAAQSSEEIVLNDAKIKLVRESIGAGAITARVIVAGELSARKGITYAATDYRQESLSEKDRTILEQTCYWHFVRYAISYVKDAVEMSKYRAQFDRAAQSDRAPFLIAKLERQPAVDETSLIASYADEVWLCRGDLGAELGLPDMAEASHTFSRLVGELSIPALLAGQVLEHMTTHPAPTRSEICAMYDALRAGYRGVVLSDETAIGQYPIESCRNAALFRD